MIQTLSRFEKFLEKKEELFRNDRDYFMCVRENVNLKNMEYAKLYLKSQYPDKKEEWEKSFTAFSRKHPQRTCTHKSFPHMTEGLRYQNTKDKGLYWPNFVLKLTNIETK